MVLSTPRRKGAVLGLVLAAVIILVDQLVKLWVVGTMQADPRVIEVTPFLNLVMAWNRGVSFGMFADAEFGPWVFLGVAVVFSVVLAVWMWRSDSRLLRLALAAMIGGALGNAIDRVRWGAVADFVDVHAFGWHFWAFNVADAAISIGAVLLIADSLFRRDA